MHSHIMQQVSDWIADIFYEVLPEAGFEVRDEQIYMAFQLERAYARNRRFLRKQALEQGKRSFIYCMRFVMHDIWESRLSSHVRMNR